MKHFNEIVGTIGAAVFGLFAAGIVGLSFTETAPKWLLPVGIGFCGVALWAIISCLKYWYRKWKAKSDK